MAGRAQNCRAETPQTSREHPGTRSMVGLCLWGFYLVRVKDSQHRLVALNFFMLNLTRDLQFLLRLPFPAQPCIHHTQVVMRLAESWMFGDCFSPKPSPGVRTWCEGVCRQFPGI